MFSTRRVRCHCCRAQTSVYAPICHVCGSKDPADTTPYARKRPWRYFLTRIPGMGAMERDPIGYGEVYYSRRASEEALRHYGAHVRQRHAARLENYRSLPSRINTGRAPAVPQDGGVMVGM
ncbi:MAG: hypothetical protein R3181_10380 [Rubricoccaceae bacterium]|nr:hypothetical protein [Rubricoccaceae bacterium]